MTADQDAIPDASVLLRDSLLEVLEELAEPTSIDEVADSIDMSKSTAYRRIQKLTDAGLVEERVRMDEVPGRSHDYVRTTDTVEYRLDG